MRTRRIARVPPLLAFWAISGLALLVSHNAVYLVQTGPGAPLAAALRDAGHGYWGIAGAALGLIGIVAVVGALARLWSLRRRARDLRAQSTSGSRGFGRRWLGAWSRLLAVVAVGFLVQENVEHFIGHGHAPGLGALAGHEYPLALPVIGLITTVAALVLAGIRQVEHVLLVSIAVALERFSTRPPRAIPRPPLRLSFTATSPMAGAWAGRAPPRGFVSAT
jgi:hypothetical protein